MKLRPTCFAAGSPCGLAIAEIPLGIDLPRLAETPEDRLASRWLVIETIDGAKASHARWAGDLRGTAWRDGKRPRPANPKELAGVGLEPDILQDGKEFGVSAATVNLVVAACLAILNFLTEHPMRPDRKFGFITRWILHHEGELGWHWSTMRDRPKKNPAGHPPGRSSASSRRTKIGAMGASQPAALRGVLGSIGSANAGI